MTCPPFETLSAYFDRAAGPDEASAVRGHLAECPACARRLRSLEAARRALAALPAPAFPQGLGEALRALAERRPWWRRLADELSAGLSQPAGVLAAAALAVALLLVWTRRGPRELPELDVPAEVLMAAHRRYALTLPLGAADSAPPEAPVQLAAGPEARDVY